MNLITETVLSHWKMGRKIKTSSSGWLSGNAPCCTHRGEKPDKRGRGGLLVNGDAFQWHCFNCNFKAGWTPGHVLTSHTRNLLSWLGVSESNIQKLSLDVIRARNDLKTTENTLDFTLITKKLPDNCRTIKEWVHMESKDSNLVAVMAYITHRGLSLDWYTWMWSDSPGYTDRVLIPYYHDGQVVGWTARKITDGNLKYLTSAQPSYVFNLSTQPYSRHYIIVVEGPIDAIAVDGIAVMSNEINEAQIARINAQGKEVIVVPDRDQAGAKLLNTAIAQSWSASLPEWDNNIKDVADAVEKYGRIYTLYTILKYRKRGEIALTMMKKSIGKYAEKQ